MARPAIEKERYVEAINKLRAENTPIRDITATKLQQLVGGQYSRCVAIMEEYTANLSSKEEAEKEPMPEWYNAFVQAITSAGEGLWITVASEMRSSVEEVATSFAKKKDQLEAQRKEDLEQIAALEKQLEAQAELADQQAKDIEDRQAKLIDAEKIIAVANATKSGLEKRLADVKAVLIDVKQAHETEKAEFKIEKAEWKTELKELKSELKTAQQALVNQEEQKK